MKGHFQSKDSARTPHPAQLTSEEENPHLPAQGATATVELRHPKTEVHLCQLAVFENFAEHGLYVKFTNEEAEQLESEALALALDMSLREAGMQGEESSLVRQASDLSTNPYPKDEAVEFVASLKERPTQAPPSNKKKKSSFKSLFGLMKKDNGSQGMDFAKEDARKAKAPVEKQELSLQQRRNYRGPLERAAALKTQLQAGLPGCRARAQALQRDMDALAAKLQKQPPSVEAANTLDAAKSKVEAEEIKVDVMEEGVDELAHLDRFLRKTKPPQPRAAALTEEIVRQLLACLDHVGAPHELDSMQIQPPTADAANDVGAMVAHFREHAHDANPPPLPPQLLAPGLEEPQTPPQTPSDKALREIPPSPPDLDTRPSNSQAAFPAPIQETSADAARPQQAAPSSGPSEGVSVPAGVPSAALPAVSSTGSNKDGAAPPVPVATATVAAPAVAAQAQPNDAPAAPKKAAQVPVADAAGQPQDVTFPAAPAPQLPPSEAKPQPPLPSQPQLQPQRSRMGFPFFKRTGSHSRGPEPVAQPLPESAFTEAENGSPPPELAPIVEEQPLSTSELAAQEMRPSAPTAAAVSDGGPVTDAAAAAARPAKPMPDQATASGPVACPLHKGGHVATAAAAAASASGKSVISAVATPAAPKQDGQLSATSGTAAAVDGVSTAVDDDQPSAAAGSGHSTLKASKKDMSPISSPAGSLEGAPMRSKSSGRPAGVRAGSRLRRLVQEKEASGGLGSQRIQPNPQVEELFTEMRNALPETYMVNDSSEGAVAADAASAAPANLSPQQLEEVKADAQRHASLINTLAKEISEFSAPNMAALVEYVNDTNARLGVIMADEASVLAQFPTWPQGKWHALKEAAETYSNLSNFARREKQWLLQRGTCGEELKRIENFADMVRNRTEAYAARQAAAEARWRLQGVPWDGSVYSAVRANSLHLATLCMSRVLFEVASLEREATLQHEACLRHLATSVRSSHKIHAFAGGFEQEQTELFDKVRRLAKYYLRVMDLSSLHCSTS